MLKILNLSQQVKSKEILKSVSLESKTGIITTLLGPNGAGKTTLLKTIIGLLRNPQKSENKNLIFFNDQIINDWATSKRVEEGISYLPQQTSLFQQLSVSDNLKIVFQHHAYWKGKKWEEFQAESTNLISQTKLNCDLAQKAHSLSGGQKRKLEIIRTILMKPKVAMFDEPFAGVDPKSIYELKEIFSNMAKQNISVIISDHNVDQLLSISDKIYVIINGEVTTSGNIKDILKDNQTKNMYFGNEFYDEISKRFL